MDWLERYVGAVKSYLPGKSRNDIGDEILSSMTDKLEAKEADMGREMKEEEFKAWLETQQHPMVLASGYQTRRDLVAGDLFPLYIHTLKVAALIIIGLKVLGAAFYVLGYDDYNFSGLLARLFGGLIESGLLAFAAVTLVFHFLGGQIKKWKYLENWTADSLPEVGHKWIAIPVGEKIFEAVAYVFLLGLVNSAYLGHWDLWWSDHVSLNPAIYEIFPLVSAVILLSLLQNLWVVVRPNWTVVKLGANIAIAAIGLWVLIMVLGVDPIVSLSPEFIANNPKLAQTNLINKIVTWSLNVVVLVYIYELGRDLYRIYRLKN